MQILPLKNWQRRWSGEVRYRRLNGLLLLACIACCGAVQAATQAVDRVRELRLAGELQAAQATAEKTIQQSGADAEETFGLHLELARIHDRYGLHYRSRPVAIALAEIDKAEALARNLDDDHRAQALLARANWYYRAEITEREFPTAIRLVNQALALLEETGDLHGQAEAVHLRGLIHLQMNELEQARAQFDRSLELDVAGGPRDFFLGEYERHVAFVYIFQERPDLAIPHLERSLQARIEAGAIDASLYAANTLANQQLAVGNLEAVPSALEHSRSVLKKLDSPHGAYQYFTINGRYWLEVGDDEKAAASFANALEAAKVMSWEAGIAQAKQYLSEN